MDTIIGVWCGRVSSEETLSLQPERDIKLSNISLGVDNQDGRSAVRLHFKTLGWDAKGIINQPNKPVFPSNISSAIICVLTPGLIEHVTTSIVLRRGEYYVFEVLGVNEVHLTGNYLETHSWSTPPDLVNTVLHTPTTVPSASMADIRSFLLQKPADRLQDIHAQTNGPNFKFDLQGFSGFQPPKAATPPVPKDNSTLAQRVVKNAPTRKRKTLESSQKAPQPIVDATVPVQGNSSSKKLKPSELPPSTAEKRQNNPPALQIDPLHGSPGRPKPFTPFGEVSKARTPTTAPASPMIKKKSGQALSNLEKPPPGVTTPLKPTLNDPTHVGHKPQQSNQAPTSEETQLNPVTIQQTSSKPIAETPISAPDTKPTAKPRQSLKSSTAAAKALQQPKGSKPTRETPRPPKPQTAPNVRKATSKSSNNPTETLSSRSSAEGDIKAPTEPPQPSMETVRAPSRASSKPSHIDRVVPVAPPLNLDNENSTTSPIPAPGTLVTSSSFENIPWRIGIRDDQTGDGAVIQRGHSIVLWYFCKIVETGFVYQQATTANGPPVSLILGNGTLPIAIEKCMEGMRVGGTRAIQVPSALTDIDMNWKEYSQAMQLPENSTVEFCCKVLGSEAPSEPASQ